MGKSIYDSIKTAAELVREVQAHGMSTAQEDLIRAADIFGHSPVKELVELANDIGMNNRNGESDPEGTWSSGRKPTRDTFYFIASRIWHWEEVVQFWNLNTNPQQKELADLRKIRDGLTSDIGLLESRIETSKAEVKAEHEARLAETSEKLKAQKEIGQLEAEVHDRDMTIMELKARLYDLLVNKEVQHNA